MNTKSVLQYIIKILLRYIDELKDIQNTESEQFQYGEKTAYTECLELLQMWEHSDKCGLNFEIEKKYPL